MSSDDDEFTRIEDLPDLEDLQEESEDFTDLESMAQDMGLDTTSLEAGDNDEDSEFSQTLSEDSDDDQVSFENTSFDDHFSEQEDNDSFLSDDSFSTDSDDETDMTTQFDTSFNSDEVSTDEDATSFISTDDFQVENNEEELLPNSQLLDATELAPTPSEFTEEKIDKTPIEEEAPATTKTSSYQAPETLQSVNTFIEQSSFGNFASEGNPPFSIILKNPKFHEDISEIAEILTEHQILSEADKTQFITALTGGQSLIPRLSEYAAILLCHKLRKFDIEILMGLTEEINPPKSYQSNDRGVTNKTTLKSNRKHHFAGASLEVEQVLTSTLNQIDGHVIKEYLGIITESSQVHPESFNTPSLDEELNKNIEGKQELSRLEELRLKRENKLASQSELHHESDFVKEVTHTSRYNMDHLYQELINELKLKAKRSKANGIVGINFSITPVNLHQMLEVGPMYQVLCTGNMVWIEKNN